MIDSCKIGAYISKLRKEQDMTQLELAVMPEQVAEMVNAGQTKVEELVEVAPMVKASALDKVVKNLDKDRINVDVIMRLAPFLGSEMLDEVIQYVEDGGMQFQIWLHS